MKLSNEENLAHYEQKYARESLRPNKDFIRQTRMLFRTFAPTMLRNPSAYRLLDLGSGTGGFSQVLADMGFSVTCFDFSAAAIAKAQSLGLTTIHGDFYTYSFVPTYHIIPITSSSHVASHALISIRSSNFPCSLGGPVKHCSPAALVSIRVAPTSLGNGQTPIGIIFPAGIY